MIKTRCGFTLVETLLVLAVVSMILTLGFVLRPDSKNGLMLSTFEKRFRLLYVKERLLAQQKGSVMTICFKENEIQLTGGTLPYPDGYTAGREEQLKIKESGFVAPKTIVFNNLKKGRRLLLVFLFGGGDYYFKESEMS